MRALSVAWGSDVRPLPAALSLLAPERRRRDGFVSFHTSRYRLHYYETPSGLRLALNTDLSVNSAREALHHIYSNVRPQ